jgi:hypothetical protein
MPTGKPASSFVKRKEGRANTESKNPKAALRSARAWGRLSAMVCVEKGDAAEQAGRVEPLGDGDASAVCARFCGSRAAVRTQQKIRTVYFIF